MLTINPAKLLGLETGTLSIGRAGRRHADRSGSGMDGRRGEFPIASRNTPFDGWKLKGRAVRTIVAGETVWKL